MACLCDSQQDTERERLAPKGYSLGQGRYPCVACRARGRFHSGNIGRDFGSGGVIHVVGGHHLGGSDQIEVGVGGWNDRVTATAAMASVSEWQSGTEG